MPSPPTTHGSLALGYGFIWKNFPEQDLVGLDSHECLAKVYKDRDVENTIGVQVQVLDTVVLE
jgi:hypothetical protein